MKRPRSVSIVDVARRAGLSATTVSRVLNKKGYFSEETAQRVEKAANELEYRPNWWARGLKGEPSKLVGLIIPDISNVFYTSVAAHMLPALRRYGYEMILCVNEEDPQVDLAYLHILDEKQVDGLIYTHPVIGNNSTFLRAMLARGMSIVEINRQRETDLLDAVLADNLRGVQQVMNYLLNQGHSRIALISGPTHTTTGGERLTAYRNALSGADIPVEPELVKIGAFNRQYGEKATAELLTLPHLPSVIFAGSNRIALGVLDTLNKRQVRIPEDISVVVFDDAEWLAAWNPPITAVDIAIGEMSQLAVELLHRRINGEMINAKPVTYHLGTSLVVRQSVGRLPIVKSG